MTPVLSVLQRGILFRPTAVPDAEYCKYSFVL
jgi:hypothetical protein